MILKGFFWFQKQINEDENIGQFKVDWYREKNKFKRCLPIKIVFFFSSFDWIEFFYWFNRSAKKLLSTFFLFIGLRSRVFKSIEFSNKKKVDNVFYICWNQFSFFFFWFDSLRTFFVLFCFCKESKMFSLKQYLICYLVFL